MTELYLRFKLRVEVGDNKMQTCINVNECRKFFFQGGSVVDFTGVAKKILQRGSKVAKFYFNHSKLRKQPSFTGTQLFGLAHSAWPFLSEPFRSEPFRSEPFQSHPFGLSRFGHGEVRSRHFCTQKTDEIFETF